MVDGHGDLSCSLVGVSVGLIDGLKSQRQQDHKFTEPQTAACGKISPHRSARDMLVTLIERES